jgi:hypothetical protein
MKTRKNKLKIVSIEEYNKQINKIISKNLSIDKKLISMLEYASKVSIENENNKK